MGKEYDVHYGEEEIKTVESGIEAIQAVMTGKDVRARERLLFYLDWYMDPYYGQDLSVIGEPLKELLQRVAAADDDIGVAEEALHLLEVYTEGPYDILACHIDDMDPELKPRALCLLDSQHMERLMTPFGEIKVLIDGHPVPYFAQEGRKLDGLCPHVLGRYKIAVSFVPDGKAHTIACVFEAACPYERTPESGERLECQSFYSDRRFKMSIALECETGYADGTRASDEYDYDAEYLENGMAFLVGMNTKTESYVFGIAWIDNVDWDDPTDENHNRDLEAWYGADPTLTL